MTSAEREVLRSVAGTVFAIDQTATHDGPGLRMTVYLKGCPLNCVWCHSPESRRPQPELVWYPTRCLHCGACIAACPEDLRTDEVFADFARDACRLCESCVDVCPGGACEVKGETMDAGQIVDQAVRQRAFFDASGGGVTLTGGEPTLQPELTLAVCKLLQAQSIHTAVETTGLTKWPILAQLADVVDLFLYDLKHADDTLHRRDTGVSNERILENLGRLCDRGAEVLVRVPCIPGLNDRPEVVTAIAEAARRAGAQRISLLPYNPATPGKYAWLQREFPLAGLKTQSADEMAALAELAARAGLEVVPP